MLPQNLMKSMAIEHLYQQDDSDNKIRFLWNPDVHKNPTHVM